MKYIIDTLVYNFKDLLNTKQKQLKTIETQIIQERIKLIAKKLLLQQKQQQTKRNKKSKILFILYDILIIYILYGS